MSEITLVHSNGIEHKISVLDEDRVRLLNSCKTLFATGDPIYAVDFLALGAVKRFLSSVDAFTSLIKSRNSFAAKTLLRTHIDTALRFSSLWLVSNPDEFATHVFEGMRINKMKDRNGDRLTDAFLVQTRSAEYPWLKTVYDNLSGYVHFSNSHFFGAISTLDDESKTAYFALTGDDPQLPDSSWIELIDCFHDATGILEFYLMNLRDTKTLRSSKANFSSA